MKNADNIGHAIAGVLFGLFGFFPAIRAMIETMVYVAEALP